MYNFGKIVIPNREGYAVSHIVGSKGQIVISKEIRQRLGVGPRWRALQRLAGDHLEVYFVPPEHSKSLKGSLAAYSKVRIPPGEEWDKARDRAWAEAAREQIEARKEIS